MLKRVLLIGSAFLLAGVILLVTMRADSGDPALPTHQTQLVPQPTTPPPFNAENTGVDPRRTPEADIEGLLFTRSNERDQLIQIFAKRSRPKPQGVHEVEWPGARIYLTPYRLLEIRAIHGMFLAPDNQPRSGQFQGRVVLTLYESAPDRILDVSPDSPDIRLRLFLEDTRFDLELGTIDSDGPVHLTSPRVDFVGTGLHLTYNEARSRLEHLVIDQGQLLRIATSAPPGPSRAANRGTGTRPSPSAAAPAAPPPTFYRAIFDHQIHIAAKDETIDADQLDAIFALAGSGQDQVMHGLGQSPPPQVAGGPATQPASYAATRPAPQPQAASQAADAPLPDDVSMLAAGQNALNITWAGPLNVEPDENPPAELHGPDESLLQLDGRPVKITTTRQETIVGARVDYLTSGGRINIEGSDDFPMVIDLGNTGILRGPSLVIDQASGKGWIPGPGTLRGRGNRPDVLDTIDPMAPPAGSGSGLPPGTVVSWGTRMDLAFYLRDHHGTGDAGASTAAPEGLADFGGSSGIRGIKTIMLTGDVDIHHPKFSLQSDQLTLALDDSVQGKQTLKQILAQGNVHSASEGDSDHPPMHLDSDQLTVDLARDSRGSMNPTDLHALGRVHATRAGQVIDAGQLDVGLESVPGRAPAKGLTRGNSPPAVANDNQGSHLALRTVHAQDNVDIQLQKPPVRITGDRADGNFAPESGQAQLLQIHGSLNHPAQLVRDDGSSLTGQDVFWSPATQKGYVPGPGKLVFSTAALRPSAGQPARLAKPAIPKKVTITWQDSMHIDNLLGSADFVGAVEVQSVMGRETADLTSDTLHADFVNQNAGDKAGGPGNNVAALADMAKPPPQINADANPLGPGRRAIRVAAAHGHVFFHSESWPETTPGQFATRLSLDGDLMTFDNLAQQVQVIGPGHMLIEDYRAAETHHPIAASASLPAATKPAALTATSGAGPAESNASPRTPSASQPGGDDTSPIVHFSGRGKTLFTWTGQLTLDANRNDMLIEQDVQMVHVPLDGSDRLQLDCRRFEAATASSGVMGSWLSDKAPQAGINSVLADHDVRVMTQHRIIRTDHLEYQGATQIITFRADLGRVTEVTEADGTNPETFQNGQMDLRKDRIEINEPGRQVEPMDKRQGG